MSQSASRAIPLTFGSGKTNLGLIAQMARMKAGETIAFTHWELGTSPTFPAVFEKTGGKKRNAEAEVQRCRAQALRNACANRLLP